MQLGCICIMNNLKRKFDETIDHIESRLNSQNIMNAREEILADIKFWRDETGQMMDDKENRIISVALFCAGALIGFLIGMLF